MRWNIYYVFVAKLGIRLNIVPDYFLTYINLKDVVAQKAIQMVLITILTLRAIGSCLIHRYLALEARTRQTSFEKLEVSLRSPGTGTRVSQSFTLLFQISLESVSEVVRSAFSIPTGLQVLWRQELGGNGYYHFGGLLHGVPPLCTGFFIKGQEQHSRELASYSARTGLILLLIIDAVGLSQKHIEIWFE